MGSLYSGHIKGAILGDNAQLYYCRWEYAILWHYYLSGSSSGKPNLVFNLRRGY